MHNPSPAVGRGVVYPRGFVAPKSGMVDVQQTWEKGDPLVTQFYHRLTQKPNDEPRISSWVFRRQVFEHLVPKFGNFNYFINRQIEAPTVYGYNLQFVLDTATFILTGKHRTVQVTNWKELCMDHPEPSGKGDPLTAQVVEELKTLACSDLAKNLVSPVPLWVSHENGFADFLASAYVFFGEGK